MVSFPHREFNGPTRRICSTEVDIRFATTVAAIVVLSATACSRAPQLAQADIRTVDGALFLADGLAGPIEEAPCTLSNGVPTTCLVIKRFSTPLDHAQGPWCPRRVTDGADAGGIWPEGGKAHDVTGAFIANLATFYDDSGWAMYNPDGSIKVTDSREECAAAARPDVDPALNNHCVQCLPAYLPASMVQETRIPKRPVVDTAPAPIRADVGLALNGVEFAAPAPTDAILAAHTLAPFDDCGGHINLHAGYHYHAVTTGCLTSVAQADGHAPQIGYALDGFPIHARLAADASEPLDLDACRGHSDATRGYHYHVAHPGTNQIIGCFSGAVAQSSLRHRGPPGNGPADAAQGPTLE